MKRRIRLTESDLHRIVNRSVKRTLNEIGNTTNGQEFLGKMQDKKINKWADENPGWDYSEEDRNNQFDIARYAYEKSRGNDPLRRAYHKGRFPDSDWYQKDYPNEQPIDVDALWNELEQYSKKINARIEEGAMDGIAILGYPDTKISLQAAYADIAYIASKYGVSNNAVTYQYVRNYEFPEDWEVKVNVAFSRQPFI